MMHFATSELAHWNTSYPLLRLHFTEGIPQLLDIHSGAQFYSLLSLSSEHVCLTSELALRMTNRATAESVL